MYPLMWHPQYVAHVYGIVFTLFAMFYAILGGMTSIVWADVIQYTIMTISAIVIGVIAMNELTDNPLVVPEGWMNPFFGARLEMDWSGIIAEVNEKIKSDGYSLFGIFFSMMLFKGVLVSPWPVRLPTTTCRRSSPPNRPKRPPRCPALYR